jgi:hypothetical protein
MTSVVKEPPSAERTTVPAVVRPRARAAPPVRHSTRVPDGAPRSREPVGFPRGGNLPVTEAEFIPAHMQRVWFGAQCFAEGEPVDDDPVAGRPETVQHLPVVRILFVYCGQCHGVDPAAAEVNIHLGQASDPAPDRGQPRRRHQAARRCRLPAAARGSPARYPRPRAPPADRAGQCESGHPHGVSCQPAQHPVERGTGGFGLLADPAPVRLQQLSRLFRLAVEHGGDLGQPQARGPQIPQEQGAPRCCSGRSSGNRSCRPRARA